MTNELGSVSSVCPVCLRTIRARKTVREDGFLYLEKECPEHGFFDALLWEGDLASYLAWGDKPGRPASPAGAVSTEKGCPYDCGLCEEHLREGCCVLLELTGKCNLHCPVCFASAGEGENGKEPGLGEIARLYDMLMARGGPFNIQLSGGEPTLREDLAEIIDLGKEKGFYFFQLNTNGVRIAEEDGYASRLADAGVSCVFLQFDGMRDSDYEALRGQPLLSKKLRAVENCGKAGLPVVLVPTIVPGINEDSMGGILDFALSHAPRVRGVHFQPVSYFGRCSFRPHRQGRITIPRMLLGIEEQTGGRMRAGDFKGGGAESPYCSFHAAYRLGKDGSLKPLAKRGNCCCGTAAPAADASPASCCSEERTVKSSEARDFVARQWGAQASSGADVDGTEASSLDAFLEEAVRQTFTVSGMLFQDAWNLELGRLKRCYICEADPERGMVPFCAYNLTDTQGRALYRK